MKRIFLVFSGIVIMLLAVGGGVTAESATLGSLADCPARNACFYNDLGQMCHWSDADPDWSSGSIRCSWARSRPAVYVINNGTSTAFTAVAFYQGTNYTDYNGCMGQGWEGWIGPAFLLSHRWITTPC